MWSLKYRHGTITDYTIDKKKHTVTIYFSFYGRNRLEQKRFCIMKTNCLYSKFRNLPMYRLDGTADLSYLEGMRVSVKAVGCFNRIFIKEMVFDLSYYCCREERSSNNG